MSKETSLDIRKYDFYKKIQSLNFVDKIVLFGSRARHDNKDRADIDLAIVCPNATDNDWSVILSIITEADTLLKIDCVRLDSLDLKSPLRQNIEKEGTELYVKNNP